MTLPLIRTERESSGTRREQNQEYLGNEATCSERERKLAIRCPQAELPTVFNMETCATERASVSKRRETAAEGRYGKLACRDAPVESHVES